MVVLMQSILVNRDVLRVLNNNCTREDTACGNQQEKITEKVLALL